MKPKFLILLTGVPGSGKTTASSFLMDKVSNLLVLRYGELLYKLKKPKYPNMTYEKFKNLSAAIITKSDIDKVDSYISSIIKKKRSRYNIIVESHSTTKEDYGFRISPYQSYQTILNLNITAVIYTYSEVNVLMKRLSESAEGRKKVNLSQLMQHIKFQDTLSLIYSSIAGCPLYAIENSRSTNEFKKNIFLIINSLESDK